MPEALDWAKDGLRYRQCTGSRTEYWKNPKDRQHDWRGRRNRPKHGSSSKNSHDIGGSGPVGFAVGATAVQALQSANPPSNSESSSAVGFLAATFHRGVKSVGFNGRIELRRL